MKELVRTNDAVLISWLTAALREVAIEAVVLDTHTAVLEGSVAAIQRRIMVDDDDLREARRVLARGEAMAEATPGPPAGDPAGIPEGAAVTVDRLLGGRIGIRQPATGYRAAIDPVLLAAAVPARAGERVLDVGCGVGTAGLCLAARIDGVRVSGVDLQRDLVALAAASARDNGMAGRVDFMVGDLLRPPPRLAAGTFDHVMANPPFAAAGQGNPPPDPAKAVASVEGEARLADWLRFCLAMVRPKGTLTVIHRADRLDELLALIGRRLGDLAIFPLWPGGAPAADGRPKPAKRVIVGGRQGVAAPLRLLPGLVLHAADGHYTEEAERIMRDGAALPL